MPEDIPIYADQALKGARGVVVGANENAYHYIHVDLERDANISAYGDLRLLVEGDSCPVCGEKLQFTRGIEVGQIFKLGTKYSEAMGATVLDENGKARPSLWAAMASVSAVRWPPPWNSTTMTAASFGPRPLRPIKFT